MMQDNREIGDILVKMALGPLGLLLSITSIVQLLYFGGLLGILPTAFTVLLFGIATLEKGDET